MYSFLSKAICLALLCVLISIKASGQGKIAGKVVDKATGEAVIGATVTVKDANAGAATDLDGRFLIDVAPGSYSLIIEYLGYAPYQLDNVEVKAGETTSVDAIIEEAAEQLQEVVVKAESPVRETANAILAQQKNAVAMVTGISAEQFRKMPDRNTSDVLKRVSGASIQDNKFAIIRGLSDRYNVAMLNGSPMPSTESDRKAFSFDLVPSNLLDNVMIVKTATPDMPADFAGGFIQINTRDIPDENLRFINIGGSTNSLTTFKEFYSSPVKSKTDLIGFDNGTRSIPQDALNSEQATATRDANVLVRQTKLFNHQFSPNRISGAAPNFGFQAGLSQRLNLFKSPLGIIVAVTYGKNFRNNPFSNTNPSIAPNEGFDINKQDGTYYNYNNYRTSVSGGLIVNLAYRIGLLSKVSFKNLYTVNADDQVIFRTGDNYSDGHQSHSRLRDYSLWYQSNRMLSSQLNFERNTDKLKIRINLGRTKIDREVPDYRRLLYTSDKPAGAESYTPYTAILLAQSAPFSPYTSGRFSSNLDETMLNAGGSVAIPFNLLIKSELKLGGLWQQRERNFAARNYTYSYNENRFTRYGILQQGPDSIFNEKNIASNLLYQRETTSPQDKYDASSGLQSAYIMLDNRITGKLRFIWGARLEIFNQKLNSSFVGRKIEVNKTWKDLLPSANLIYTVTEKSNVRASFSKTISRPEFREFAPLSFLDFNLNAIVIGNPDLERAEVYNYDLRYEIFPNSGTVFSITPFYKRFIKPVESAIQPNASNRTFTYLNAKSAESFGAELEARFTLGFLGNLINAPYLNNVSIFSNYALISSTVDLSGTGANTLGKRPLQGQSPYVFNGGITYNDQERKLDISLALNRIGRRISYVANEEYQLIWENSRTVLDFSISKTFFKKLNTKFVVGDILAKQQPLVFYQDTNSNKKYDKGTDVETFKYLFGTSVNLSLGYNF